MAVLPQGSGLLAKMKQRNCFVDFFVGSFSVEMFQWKMWLSQLVSSWCETTQWHCCVVGSQESIPGLKIVSLVFVIYHNPTT